MLDSTDRPVITGAGLSREVDLGAGLVSRDHPVGGGTSFVAALDESGAHRWSRALPGPLWMTIEGAAWDGAAVVLLLADVTELWWTGTPGTLGPRAAGLLRLIP